MRPPISARRRRAVRILATRNRRGKNPQGCWPNAMTGSARLFTWGAPTWPPIPPGARGAADEVVPEVADVEREVHRDHEGLRGHGREEHRAAAHAAEEERHQEEAEQDAVEDRAEDVDGLDEVLREPGEERERHREDAPQRREASRHAHVARLVGGGERAEVVPSAASSEAFDDSAAANITASSRPTAPCGSCVRMNVMKT